MGLLAGTNDMAMLAASVVGRDINRQHFRPPDIEAALQRPVGQRLIALIRLRNAHPAFGGPFQVLTDTANKLHLQWRQGEATLALQVDLRARRHRIVDSLQA